MRKCLLILIAVISLLAGCGSSTQEDFANRVGQAMRAPANDPTTTTSLGSLRRVAMSAANSSDSISITPDQLFDWAEATYPQFFPTREKTLTWSVYQFRYYKDTDVYLAVESGTKVVALGKPTGGAILSLGFLAAFAPNVNSYNSNSLFEEVYDALPEPSLMVADLRDGAKQIGLSINPGGVGFYFQIAVDLNGDGKKELLIGASTYQIAGSFTMNPGYGRLYVFALNQTGKFEDQTNKFIEGGSTIRSQWGAGTVFDFNSDGRPDIIFATHQEDGRNEDNGSDLKAYPVALISQPSGKYRLTTFGQLAWNLNNPINLKLGNGEPLLLINNNGWRTYAYRSSDIVELKELGGLDFQNLGGIFAKTLSNTISSQYLIVSGIYPNVYSLRLYKLDSNFLLTQLDNVDVGYKIVGTSNYETWQGSLYPVNVLTDGKDLFLGGGGYGLDGGCGIKSADQSISFLSWGSLPKIVNYNQGNKIVKIGEIENILVQYKFERDRLISSPVSIENWDRATARWGTYCEDLNGDGYDDVWVHALRAGSNNFYPIIYINQRNGMFKKVSDSDLPKFSIPNEARLALLVSDFDGDGIADFVTIPELGDGTIEKQTFRFFRGKRRLK